MKFAGAAATVSPARSRQQANTAAAMRRASSPAAAKALSASPSVKQYRSGSVQQPALSKVINHWRICVLCPISTCRLERIVCSTCVRCRHRRHRSIRSSRTATPADCRRMLFRPGSSGKHLSRTCASLSGMGTLGEHHILTLWYMTVRTIKPAQRMRLPVTTSAAAAESIMPTIHTLPIHLSIELKERTRVCKEMESPLLLNLHWSVAQVHQHSKIEQQVCKNNCCRQCTVQAHMSTV
jgi:hypothetical protein